MDLAILIAVAGVSVIVSVVAALIVISLTVELIECIVYNTNLSPEFICTTVPIIGLGLLFWLIL